MLLTIVNLDQVNSTRVKEHLQRSGSSNGAENVHYAKLIHIVIYIVNNSRTGKDWP